MVHREAIPQVFILACERAVQGDRNAVNRALNSLKSLWDVPQDEIDALQDEAQKICDNKDAWKKTPEGRWVNHEKQPLHGKLPHNDTVNPWGRVTLRADLDGVVIECNVRTGEMVVDKTVTLFQIADTSRLQVVAHCPESALRALDALPAHAREWTVRKVGMGSDMAATGAIVDIGQVIDPQEHTAVIKGYVDNPGHRLRAGQYITATLNVPPPDDVVEIPADALADDGKQSLVLVQPEPSKQEFTLRRVEVTERRDDKVLVRSTAIAQEKPLTAAQAEQGLLPKEPLRRGERVLVHGTSESVDDRLTAVEEKLDELVRALGTRSRPAATKANPHATDAPR
jgi:cobalt-zinc-cadmium efflux system membrane fusion protein